MTQAGAKYAQYVLEIIEKLKQTGSGLAGFIRKSLPSVRVEQIVMPPTTWHMCIAMYVRQVVYVLLMKYKLASVA